MEQARLLPDQVARMYDELGILPGSKTYCRSFISKDREDRIGKGACGCPMACFMVDDNPSILSMDHETEMPIAEKVRKRASEVCQLCVDYGKERFGYHYFNAFTCGWDNAIDIRHSDVSDEASHEDKANLLTAFMGAYLNLLKIYKTSETFNQALLGFLDGVRAFHYMVDNRPQLMLEANRLGLLSLNHAIRDRMRTNAKGQ